MSDRLADARQLLEEQVQERTRELETMLEVSQYLASTLELDELLTIIFEQLQRVVDCSGATVSLLEKDGSLLLLDCVVPGVASALPRRRRMAESTGWLEERLNELREPIIIPDVQADTAEAAAWRQNAIRAGHSFDSTRAWMGVPLVAGNRAIGMMGLRHRQPGYYSAHHARLALALGNHVAVAIENARLFQLEQRRAEQLRATVDVSCEISAYLAFTELANQAAYHIQQAFGYYHVHIGLVEGDEVIFRPATGVWREERQCHYCSRHRFLVGHVGASGRVAATGEPLLVRDVQRDTRYLPMDDSQHGSALVLPLKARGENIGVLNIESDDVDGFSEMDIGVLQPLANQLAVALENARLYEQAQELAALRERQKLARDLHDSVSQALYGIGLGTQTALKLMGSEQAEKEAIRPPLEYINSLATTGLAEMRALIFELRPESLAVEGLIPALTRRLDAVRARHEIEVEAALTDEPNLPVSSKEVLYRVAQEALHNVVKHAGARCVAVSLENGEDQVILEIRDDGCGFDPQADFPGHLGLQSMRERVQGASGTLTIESAPGQGATVRAVLPRVVG